MEETENPTEKIEEDLRERAAEARERWIMVAALTSAIFAALAAVASMLSGHHANEAMLEQLMATDQWNYYQAKGIKANLLRTKNAILAELGKTADPKDEEKLGKYEKDQEKTKELAEEKQRESATHLRHHTFLSLSVTMFQVGIAISAIAVLTKRRRFWGVAMAFGLAGLVLFVWGLAG
jgi:hypothetical protein